MIFGIPYIMYKLFVFNQHTKSGVPGTFSSYYGGGTGRYKKAAVELIYSCSRLEARGGYCLDQEFNPKSRI